MDAAPFTSEYQVADGELAGIAEAWRVVIGAETLADTVRVGATLVTVTWKVLESQPPSSSFTLTVTV